MFYSGSTLPLMHLATVVFLIAAAAGSCPSRRVCYYTSKSKNRPDSGRFWPEDIDPSLCSHVIFASAKLADHLVAPLDSNDVSTASSKGLYERLNDLKSTNPQLKTLLSVGGQNVRSVDFSRIVSNHGRRHAFTNQAINYVIEHGFDGLDLQWLYPASYGSSSIDKLRLTSLFSQLRHVINTKATELNSSHLLLTATVSARKHTIDKAYQMPQIASHLDFINLMAYDFHGDWEERTGHNSPLYADSSESGHASYLNVDYAASYWVQKGMPKEKLVIGVPFYGRSFKLKDPANDDLGALANGPGRAGSQTQESGVLAYFEVCTRRQHASRVDWIESMKVPFLVSDGDWVAYDNQTSIIEKVQYINDNDYGGVMIWAIDLDDFNGTFCDEGKYPLLETINLEC